MHESNDGRVDGGGRTESTSTVIHLLSDGNGEQIRVTQRLQIGSRENEGVETDDDR